MKAFAKQLFSQSSSISLLQPPRWPWLWQLVEENVLLSVDYLFAERLYPELSELKASFLAFLLAWIRQGHLCLDLNKWPLFIEQMQITEVHQTKMKELLIVAEGLESWDPPIHQEGKRLYLEKQWLIETDLLDRIKWLSTISPQEGLIQLKPDSPLSPEQKQAIEQAISHSLSLVTGGPGTGKTYTAVQLICSCRQDARILVTAPTGKAAMHLERQLRKLGSDYPYLKAGTLHSLLGISSRSHLQKKSSLLFADLIIVDECSMIDAALFAYFLKAIREGTRLVLMGDAQQLPPIESGSVFADLFDAAKEGFPLAATHLTHFMRSDRQDLLSLMQKIQSDEEIIFNSSENIHVQELNIYQKGLTASYELLWNKITSYLATLNQGNIEQALKKLDLFRMLSPLRKGPLGVDTLNDYFLEKAKDYFRAKSSLFIPILITQNNEEIDLFNGEMGLMVKSKADQMPLVYFPEKNPGEKPRQFSLHELPRWEYGFCLSVHKSQGSEFDHVALLIPPGSEEFGRELVYTAVTRAKQHLEIIGESRIIQKLLKKRSRKMSGIKERLFFKN